ncbi:MAG TPA: hypothetical protein P5522_10350 [Spirochaetia bacterium]|nr:hypothetical protein [Spirochaetia bacterium]
MSKYPHHYIDSKGEQHDIEKMNDTYLINAYKKIERIPLAKRKPTQQLSFPYMEKEILARGFADVVLGDDLPKLKLPDDKNPESDF